MATVAPGRDYSWLDNLIKVSQVRVAQRQNQIDAGVRSFMASQKTMDPDKMAAAMDEIEGVGWVSKLFGGGNKAAKLVNPYADPRAGKEVATAAAFKEMERQGGWMSDVNDPRHVQAYREEEKLSFASPDKEKRGGHRAISEDVGRYDRIDKMAQQSDVNIARESYRVGDTYGGKGSDQLQGILDNYNAGGSYDQFRKSALEWAHVYGVEPTYAMSLAAAPPGPGGRGAGGKNFLALDRYGNPLYTHAGSNADEARAAILKKYPNLKPEDVLMTEATPEALKLIERTRSDAAKRIQADLAKKKGWLGGYKKEDIEKAKIEAAKYKYTVTEKGTLIPTGEEMYDRPGGGGELDPLVNDLLGGPGERKNDQSRAPKKPSNKELERMLAEDARRNSIERGRRRAKESGFLFETEEEREANRRKRKMGAKGNPGPRTGGITG